MQGKHDAHAAAAAGKAATPSGSKTAEQVADAMLDLVGFGRYQQRLLGLATCWQLAVMWTCLWPAIALPDIRMELPMADATAAAVDAAFFAGEALPFTVFLLQLTAFCRGAAGRLGGRCRAPRRAGRLPRAQVAVGETVILLTLFLHRY